MRALLYSKEIKKGSKGEHRHEIWDFHRLFVMFPKAEMVLLQ